jgi:transcriptional regulator with XRE-family HTH domain
MSLARRVRRSLKAKGLTQQDLVNRTGLSQAHISHVMTVAGDGRTIKKTRGIN